MSIRKTVALLGIGHGNIRTIRVDDFFHMIPDDLAHPMEFDTARGIPGVVVATAGTVNTGAIDPLREIAFIASKHDAWLHIDGAYGALAGIAAPDKLSGLELANSISLDPHKWLYQPLDCGCLLYRDQRAARRTFSISGDYFRPLSEDSGEGYAIFEESMELSRGFQGRPCRPVAPVVCGDSPPRRLWCSISPAFAVSTPSRSTITDNSNVPSFVPTTERYGVLPAFDESHAVQQTTLSETYETSRKRKPTFVAPHRSRAVKPMLVMWIRILGKWSTSEVKSGAEDRVKRRNPVL